MIKVKLGALTLISTLAAMLACTSCSSTPKGKSSTEVIETKGGKTMVETYETTATVTAIDPATRHITLTAPDGNQTTFKAGPEIRNFDQIRVGDQVKTTATEEVAVSLRPQGTPATTSQSSTVTTAPRGAKPGVLSTETTEVTAKITALDTQNRHVTLQFPDSTTRTVKVSDQVDLTRVKPGDDVVMQFIESIAINVEKP